MSCQIVGDRLGVTRDLLIPGIDLRENCKIWAEQSEKAKTKMAAQVRTKKGKAKPSLINKLELSGDTIHSAVFIPHEDSIITVASDKYVLIL